MFLHKLSVTGFKNIGQAAMEFSGRINCFVGDNGAGKTNLLDAVHYLSMCKSAFTMTDGQSIGHGGEFFVIDGSYSDVQQKREHVICAFRKGSGKSVRRNGKEHERLSDHIGLIPVVMVAPCDSALVSDSADERRRWINSFLSQLDREYLAAIVRYNHLLGERNALLKSDGAFRSPEIMEIIDSRMVEAGETVHRLRAAMTARIAPLVAEYYRELSGDREQVGLEYHSELNEAPLAEILRRSAEKDSINRFTTSGVHRDDLKMTIGGYPLRRYGSQGQQKSFLVALKLAQYSVTAEEKGEKPLLLLDDLFDKLDAERVERLIKLVSGEGFGQIFITDCSRERLEAILRRGGEAYSLFTVTNGQISLL